MNAFARLLLRSAVLSAVCALSHTAEAAPAAEPPANLVPLHTFQGGNDGARPYGALYGTTYYGGVSNSGSVFRLAPDGTETVLHSFTTAEDGADPYAGLIRDKQGNFYGTAEAGGEPQLGVVFKVSNQ